MSQTKDKAFANSSIHGASINSGSITIGTNSHQSLQTSAATHLPLHSVRSSGSVSQQTGHASITYPLQLTSNLTLPNALIASQPNTPASTTITDAKKIHLQISNQLSKNIEHSVERINDRKRTITVNDPSMIVSSHEIQKKPLQIKLQSVPGAIPIQTSRSLQISSNAVSQVPMSGNSVPVNLQTSKLATAVISSQPQSTTTNKSTPHMIYIHTSTGVKSVPSTDILPTTTVRLPGSSGIQLISSLNAKTSTVKTLTNKPNEFTGNLPQSLVIQKPKTSSQNLVSLPVNLSANPSGKHTFAAFVSAIKKPPPASKPPESQKVIITPMNVPKVYNKLIFPQSVPSKAPYTNFQIANGQVQNDPQGSITVMQDSTNCVIPPLQPITSVETITNESPAVSNIILDSQTSDNSFTTSIPGSRAELIGEQEYTLSIPDNSCMSDEVITVSISDDNEGSHEASYTINIPGEQNDIVEDNTTVIDGTQCVISTKLPGILSRSSSDDCERVEQRRIANDKNADDIENKIEKAKKKLFNKSYSILKKSSPDKDGTSQNQSLYCEETIDHEAESKIAEVEMVQPMKKPVETTVPSIPLIVKDRRKSRISSDVYLQSEPTIIVDKDLTAEEDSLGIQWQNNIGKLNGSFLQFHTNEFGLIDVVDSPNDVSSSLPKYQTPLKQRIPRDGVKKPTSPEDLYCCDGCGCHGMAAEFITPNFCSHTCQRNHNKDNAKDKGLVDLKKKRKPRKSLLSKTSIREDDGCNISKIIPKSSLDSLSQDITVKMIPSDTGSQKSASKWKHENGFIWYVYLDCCNAIQAPEKLFRISKESKHNFKPGMKVEAIDPHNQSLFTVVTITEIQGYRLKLHFDGYEDNYDYWVNADSCDIFPPGWCEKNGKALRPPQGYTRNTFSWAQYVKQTKAILAPRYLFPHVLSVNPSPSIFRVGMKLEAEDRKNSLTCVATITDVMDNRLLIHFDSWNEKYDFWVQPTSPYIHPVGWCDKNGYRLTPPNTYKDPERFTWEGYLGDSRSPVAPLRAFKARPPLNFKVGMKLEAVDKRVPFLIRVATVSEVRPYQIRISFDGLPDELSFWVDDDSPDIYPVGWCLKTGHPLEPPLTQEESKIAGPCGTNGCQGLGNMNGKSGTHTSAAECPYHLPPKSPEIPDRLASAQPPPQYTEPRPREPKRNQRGRPPKYKPLENDHKLETASDDDSSCSATKKRKRAVSPMSQETVERSVFEPGYTPNPNWNAPPTWGLASRCMPLDDILQRLSLRTDPRNWSQTDVQEFVEKIAKSREVSWRFCKQRIDGESFLMLAQEDLVSVLGMRLGPAIKMYNSIIQLRKKIVV